MSPGSTRGRRSAIVPSTAAAGTIIQTARGFLRFLTNSASDAAPTAFSRASSPTAAGDRSKTTHWWPPLRSRRTMLAPMRPNPIIPSCMARIPCGLRVSQRDLLERVALGGDHGHQLVPGLHEARRAFVLEPGRQRVDVDAGFREAGQHLFAV